MCDKADKDYEDETKEDVKEGSRKSKRSLKLLRGNERDLKLDVEAAHNYAEKYPGDITVSTPNQIKVREMILSIGRVWKTQRLYLWLMHISKSTNPYVFPRSSPSNAFQTQPLFLRMYLASSQAICFFSQVETRNRFRCLRSKPVDVEEKKVEREVSERSVLIYDENLHAQSPRTQSLREREIFHDTFSFLIKLVNILLHEINLN